MTGISEAKYKDMDKKRDTARGELNKELQQISHFMGRVEEYMVDRNKGE